MKLLIIIIVANLSCVFSVSAQQFNKTINKDSLVKNIIKDMPENKKKEFLASYKSGSDIEKEFLLFTFSMPRSSKNEMIKNIEVNYEKIYVLKSEYAKLVPGNYTVSIEFNPENKMVSTPESIDMKIERIKNKETTNSQEWNMEYNSGKLNNMLSLLKWNYETLKSIKKLLFEANCVSIENGKEFTIGFARSGLGKYSYVLFDNDLEPKQIKPYNDGCNYIFYKKNIVLEYEGGAVGSQCFPD